VLTQPARCVAHPARGDNLLGLSARLMHAKAALIGVTASLGSARGRLKADAQEGHDAIQSYDRWLDA